MSPDVASVLAAAESLRVEERREWIELLLGGLDDSPLSENGGQPSLTEAWKEAVARRSAEYDAGTADTVSWQDVQARKAANC